MIPNFVIAGRLSRDYILPLSGHALIDVPGGNLLYSASGLGVWENAIGLLGRIGEDYPHEWLKLLEKHGWDRGGIRILTEPLELRHFEAWLSLQDVQYANPVAHFARLNLPFPKPLFNYQPTSGVDDDRKTLQPASPRPADIPPNYLNTHAAHFCPLDYVTTSRLLPIFRQAGVTALTLDPSAAFMNTAAFEDVRALVHRLTAFLPSEEELRTLFWGRTDDLWQMAEALGGFGCEFVVVKRGARGQLVYDSASKKRWEVPAYPARLVNLTGAGDAFCGGFLAGYQKTYDPLRAALYGSVSASLTVEGSGAFHALEALPGLAQARLDSMAESVRQV